MRLFVVFFLFPILIFCQEVKILPIPDWVHKVEGELSPKELVGGAIHYLILDYQDHVELQESYTHVSYKILNDEGVQSYSSIEVDFDPTYQQLHFHKISVIREGEIINKLKKSEINTIQRESDMSRNLYDGSLTSYINLTDIRSGDIVEYAYSKKGFNPVFGDDYASSYYQDFTVSVDKLYVRVISNKKVFWSQINGAIPLKQKGNEYSVELSPELIQYESNTPGWYTAQRMLFLSTYRDWEDIASWALPLYDLSTDEILKTAKALDKDLVLTGTKKQQAIAAIRFVQDEIRYLGFESGIKGYQPHKPTEVLERRFGDCKDKSNLLVAILRSVDIEAYPMLVNSYKRHRIDEEQASPYAFDHCVVSFSLDGASFYVDPTINNQGGDLANNQFPNYERGLIIKSGTEQLIQIGKTQELRQLIEETITVHGLELDAKASFTVKTTYSKTSANNIRSYFKNNSLPSIANDYTNFYSSIYPGVSAVDEILFNDTNRSDSNQVTVEEFYEIENFWGVYQETGLVGEVYPILLETYLSSKAPSIRKMPYYLGGPVRIEERIKLIMPEDWNVTSGTEVIDGLGFYYESSASGEDNEISLNYTLRLDSTYLSPESARDFLEKRDKILGDLSFSVSYNQKSQTDSSDLSWWSILLTVVFACIGILLSIKAYRYNPDAAPGYKDHNQQLGGWLIVLAIGLTLTPFRMLYEFGDLIVYWQASSWLDIKTAYTDNYFGISLLILCELLFNTLFLVFSLLVVVVFYQRRTSAPQIITFFLLTNLGFVVLDTFVAGILLETGTEMDEIFADIIRSMIYAGIWCTYLYKSERVKSTFTRLLGGRHFEAVSSEAKEGLIQ